MTTPKRTLRHRYGGELKDPVYTEHIMLASRLSSRTISLLLIVFGLSVAAIPATSAAPTAEREVALPNAIIHYRERGAGPPVLFVHALLLDSRLWLDQLESLCERRRCLAPDLRGHGHSSPLLQEQVDYERYTQELIEFLDATGVDGPADIVGLSAGGNLAVQLCRKAPARCRSLTLISTVLDGDLDAATIRYRKENARTVVLEGKDALFRRFNEYIVSPSASMYARARYRSMLEQTPYETLVAFFSTTSTPRASADGAPLDLPVMIPIGSADSVVSTELAQRSTRFFTRARVVSLDSAGRLLPLEAPQELNRALQEFWQQLD
jgi:pimeloyl-ACP methyl ester carboxylesterase